MAYFLHFCLQQLVQVLDNLVFSYPFLFYASVTKHLRLGNLLRPEIHLFPSLEAEKSKIEVLYLTKAIMFHHPVVEGKTSRHERRREDKSTDCPLF
jgi:hypothetical protein